MQIPPQDSEDQQVIIIARDIKRFQPAQKQSKTCLKITAIFTLLFLAGYFFYTWEAFHESQQSSLRNKKTQKQAKSSSPQFNQQNASPKTTQKSTKDLRQKSTMQNAFPLQFYEYAAQLSQLQHLINKIEQSATVHLCLLPQKLFHYYQANTKTMYFQTAYDLILPSCQNKQNYPWSINRENIHTWNHHRQVIEWALTYIRPKDHIFYYRPNNYNILQIAILSKIVGEEGSITIFNSDQISVCMRQVNNFHSIRAPIRYSTLTSFEPTDKYNVFIISDPNLLNSKNTSSRKSLVYTQDPNTLKKYNEGFIIKKVTLPPQTCSELQLSDQLSGKGFYSLLNDGEQWVQKPLIKKSPVVNSIRATVESQYNSFKQIYKSSILNKQQFLLGLRKEKKCYDINAQRKEQGFMYTVYGHKIYNVSLQELQGWQKEREAVEWVRSLQSNTTEKDVYYEIQSKFNLLSVLEIALLLNSHSLTVVCSPAQCDRINQQIIANKQLNIKLIKLSDSNKALSSGIIITDNQSLITTILESNFLLSGSLLGLFNYKVASSLTLIRKLYVKHHLREVTIDNTKRQCIGFQYRHFFWRSWQPQGFYDIALSKDVIYLFWGGHPSKLNIMRKLLVDEVVSLNIQAKILSVETFLPFEIANSPIHPAFHLLTSIQKSDYMRVYIMHHYGGGYTDVKHTHVDLKPYLEDFKQQKDKLALGYAEIHDFDVPCFEEGPPSCREIRSQYHRIIGNGYYFFKKQTVLTTEWFNRVTANLDRKLDDLRKNPPRVPRECLGRSFILPDGTRFISKYPFRWAQIANEHLARTQYKYLENVSTALPYLINVDYRTNDNLIQN